MKLSNYTVFGKLILGDEILENGAVAVENGSIVYAGPADGAPRIGEQLSTEHYIGPGFVDIHCHAGDNKFVHEDPAAVADFHLSHGTTGMLMTMYRDVGHERTLAAIHEIKSLMTPGSNILGVHMEGPYLNSNLGSGLGKPPIPVEEDKYHALGDTGIIRQWTYAPELEGMEEFLRYVVSMGIVPAIGHSAASPEEVFAAEKGGARIVTHLFDAMGQLPTRWTGTVETDTAHATLLCDELYYEVICDEKGIHVRHDMIKLAIKTVGIDRIVGITDCFVGEETMGDVYFIDGLLSGSRLTMDMVAKNFRSLGLSLPDVFKVVSANPAKAIRMDTLVGSLTPGCRGDVVIVDGNLQLIDVIKAL